MDSAPARQSGRSVLNCIPRGTKLPKDDSANASAAAQEAASARAPYDRSSWSSTPATGELADVRILQQGGVELEFRFGQWQQGLPLEAAMFRFPDRLPEWLWWTTLCPAESVRTPGFAGV